MKIDETTKQISKVKRLLKFAQSAFLEDNEDTA